jgi:hypothetical protein
MKKLMVSRGPPTYYRARAHRENPFFPIGLSDPVFQNLVIIF